LFKEIEMRGSIRFVVGLLLVMGAVGGMDNATDADLIPLTVIAFIGLALIAWGNTAMNIRSRF
jgi:hypothetical protein